VNLKRIARKNNWKIKSIIDWSLSVKFLSQSAKGDVLSLDSQIPFGSDGSDSEIFKFVKTILSDKHPPAKSVCLESLLECDSVRAPLFNPVLLDTLTGNLVKIRSYS